MSQTTQQAGESAGKPGLGGKSIGVLLLILAVVCIGAGTWAIVDESKLGSSGAKTVAKVTEARIATKGSSSRLEVRYQFTVDGQNYSASERFPYPQSNLWIPLIGETADRAKARSEVEVVYNPGNPQVNRPAEPAESATKSAIMMLVAGVVVGLIGVVAMKPNKKPATA